MSLVLVNNSRRDSAASISREEVLEVNGAIGEDERESEAYFTGANDGG